MVTKLKYGNTNTFFISGKDGGLLVDTDYAGTIFSFISSIANTATAYGKDYKNLSKQIKKLKGEKRHSFKEEKVYQTTRSLARCRTWKRSRISYQNCRLDCSFPSVY